MRRIQDPTAVAALPAAPVLTGQAGYFSGGDPVGGLPATRVRAWWLNMIQEELLAIVVESGLAPSNADLGQALRALRIMLGEASGQFVPVTNTQSLTVPGWARRAHARIWGGGGAGGNASGPGAGAQGGGAGGYREGIVDVTPNAQVVCTVGAGATSGGAGGTSSFGSMISAYGGTGGGTGINGIYVGVGTGQGGGGAGVAGQLTVNGYQGGYAYPAPDGGVMGGTGGATFGTSITPPNASSAGNGGQFPGGGGSGASNNSTGGDKQGGSGANGLILVRWLL